MDEFERSGLSGAAFAKLHGIKYSTFASWSLKRRKKDHPRAARRKRKAQTISLAEIVVDGQTQAAWNSPAGLRIHLPGGAWLQLDGHEEQSKLVAQLLKALQA